MIQAIGIMVGCYIFTRMLEINMENKPGAVQFFATATMIITCICMFILLVAGGIR